MLLPNIITAIPTEVLRIHIRDIKRPDLETHARKLRYFALGEACLNWDMSYILFGHHEDDDYETFLFRISRKHHPNFLLIRPDRNMPEHGECYGIYNSGNMRILPSLKRQRFWDGKNLDLAGRVVGIEDGGLSVGRPLLEFPKDRLIATCRKLSIPWIEDETNKDRTLTVRNALRHIVKNHKLPAALTKDRFLQVRDSIRERQRISSLVAEKLFDMCDISLDVRNGTAQVRFPKVAVLKDMINNSEPLKYTDSIQVEPITALLLKNVQGLVSPAMRTSIAELDRAVKNILTPLRGEADYDEDRPRLPYFRIGTCQYQHYKTTPDMNTDTPLDPWTWMVTRARFPSWVIEDRQPHLPKIYLHNQKSTLDPSLARDPFWQTNIRIPIQCDGHQPKFHLWDRRFWIRVRHYFDSDLQIKPLTYLHWGLIRKLIKHEYFDFAIPELNIYTGGIDELDDIKILAKGDVKFTLPVIEGPALPDGMFPIPIAIPTLGLRMSPRGNLRELWKWPSDVLWEVRFRKVDLGTNWEQRLAAEDEQWSWNKPVKSSEMKEPISTPIVDSYQLRQEILKLNAKIMK